MACLFLQLCRRLGALRRLSLSGSSGQRSARGRQLSARPRELVLRKYVRGSTQQKESPLSASTQPVDGTTTRE